MHSDSLVMPGYGSRCRSHCCDLQTGEIVSGDVGCGAISAKRISAGSALRMTALVEGGTKDYPCQLNVVCASLHFCTYGSFFLGVKKEMP